MGCYARYVLPRLIELAMRNKTAAEQRARFVPLAAGRVLEIGMGSGLNLPYYASDVVEVLGVDPSPALREMAARRAEGSAFPVAFIGDEGERLALEDRSVDTVVSTWTLCTIADPAAAMAEVRRVLKPAGRFIFVEHGRAPERRVAAWQDRLTPIQKRIAGGCRLNRQIDALVAGAGLRAERIETRYLRGPRPFVYHTMGVARPA